MGFFRESIRKEAFYRAERTPETGSQVSARWCRSLSRVDVLSASKSFALSFLFFSRSATVAGIVLGLALFVGL